MGGWVGGWVGFVSVGLFCLLLVVRVCGGLESSFFSLSSPFFFFLSLPLCMCVSSVCVRSPPKCLLLLLLLFSLACHPPTHPTQRSLFCLLMHRLYRLLVFLPTHPPTHPPSPFCTSRRVCALRSLTHTYLSLPPTHPPTHPPTLPPPPPQKTEIQIAYPPTPPSFRLRMGKGGGGETHPPTHPPTHLSSSATQSPSQTASSSRTG